MLLEQVKCTVNPFIPDRAESYKGFVFPSQKLAITTLIGIGGVRLVLSGSSLSLQLFFFLSSFPCRFHSFLLLGLRRCSKKVLCKTL